MFEFKKRQIY